MTTATTKRRLIQISKEQEERMAAQAHAKAQAFTNEANMIQARRCEVMVALMSAETTKNGIDALTPERIEACRQAAHRAVDADAKQKFTDLKALFKHVGLTGPQPHLSWAAAQVGVELFDPEEDAPLIIEPTPEQLVKVIQ